MVLLFTCSRKTNIAANAITNIKIISLLLNTIDGRTVVDFPPLLPQSKQGLLLSSEPDTRALRSPRVARMELPWVEVGASTAATWVSNKTSGSLASSAATFPEEEESGSEEDVRSFDKKAPEADSEVKSIALTADTDAFVDDGAIDVTRDVALALENAFLS